MKKLMTISWFSRLLLPSIFIGLLCISACGDKNTSVSAGEKLPEDFVEFYDRFHKDSAYQMTHIVFPLQGKPNNAKPGTDYSDYHWSEENWILHKDFGKLLDSYSKRYSGDSIYIIEEIYHNTEAFKIERRFSRIGKQWFLVYYAGLTMEKSLFDNPPPSPSREPIIELGLLEEYIPVLYHNLDYGRAHI